MIREGFWSPEHTPAPSAAPWEGQAEFLRKLAAVEAEAHVVQFRGWSNCRVCTRPNGSREFLTAGATWPSGFYHYIEAHNVEPSIEFREYIEKLYAR